MYGLQIGSIVNFNAFGYADTGYITDFEDGRVIVENEAGTFELVWDPSQQEFVAVEAEADIQFDCSDIIEDDLDDFGDF